MLYEISREIDAQLQVKLAPYRVHYGPENADPDAGLRLTTPRIVIERDRQAGDRPRDGRSRTNNAKMLAAREVGAVCRIFAQSTVDGARVEDHERIADQLADMVTCALHVVATTRKAEWRISSAKLLTAEEVAQRGLQVWPGAVYELRFSVDRGVYDTDWTGAAAAEKALGTDSSSIKVRTTGTIGLQNAPEGTPGEATR